MVKIRTTLIYITCLSVASCLRRPRMKPKVQSVSFFPKELRSPGQNINPDLRIPNENFCSEMQLHQAQYYMVLPWWRGYCDKLHEAKQKQQSIDLSVYRTMLDHLQRYKKMERMKSYQQ